MGFIDSARDRLKKDSESNEPRLKDNEKINVSKEEPILNENELNKNNNEEIKSPILEKQQTGTNEKIDNNYQETFSSEIVTPYDEVIKFLRESGGKAKIKEIDAKIGSSSDKILKILKDQNVISINYPINIFSQAVVNLKEIFKDIKKTELPKEKKLNDSYKINVDGVIGIVNIWESDKEDVPFYEIMIPKIDIGTEAFVNKTIEELAKKMSFDENEIKDYSKYDEFKINIINKIKEEIKLHLKLSENDLNILAGITFHKMLGLGDLEMILGDNWLEEIAINGSNVPVSVFHKRMGWTKTNFFLKDDEDIYNLASQIGRKVGRQINSLNPLMDAHLVTGDRIAATLKPISTSGNTMTIRRFSRNPWTIVHMIDPKINTMSVEIAAFLWLCIQYELNVLVAGGTASGKTSALNSICSLIPATQRIISIEDTREISLPDEIKWNWVPLSSRKPNPEGQGGVSMLDLMVESLRMRPDRIIVGEVRRKEQAETLFETMHTGHSVYATIHADTVEQVERRLIEPPIEIPKSEVGALQLIVVQYRDRRRGARRTLEVAEVLSQEGDDKNLGLNYLFRWKPRSDTFEKINSSIRIMEDLNLHTGMTENDIQKDLKEKETILNWMLKHNVKDVDLVGKIMKVYYKSPNVIINLAQNDLNPEEYFK